MGKEHSAKCERFLAALRELCQSHGVTLASSGYDAMRVWDWDGSDDPLHFNGIDDRTRETAMLLTTKRR